MSLDRAREIERCARALLARLEVIPYFDTYAMPEARALVKALGIGDHEDIRAALSLSLPLAPPTSPATTRCPMCKSEWPSVLFDPCERITAPDPFHARDGGKGEA